MVMLKMTKRAAMFEAHNRLSPVVYGTVIGGDKGSEHVTGVMYRLANDKTFKLSCEDSRSLPCMPRWAHA